MIGKRSVAYNRTRGDFLGRLAEFVGQEEGQVTRKCLADQDHWAVFKAKLFELIYENSYLNDD